MNIYTDGATSNNQNKKLRKGGIGVFFGDNDNRNISMEIHDNPTNQRMELIACIKALEISDKDVNIYTDSQYTINCVTKWYNNWKCNNWKTSKGTDVKNLELIKQLYNLVKSKNVNFYHVKAHQKAPNDKNKYKHWYGNKMADYLATSSIS